MIGIYKITSPSGKVYIGQSINIEQRFLTYKRLICKSQTRLYHSLIKHGYSSHKFEVICECGIEKLNELERHYQDLYNSTGDLGLNCISIEINGKKGRISEETRIRLRDSHMGQYIPESQRRKMSLSHKGKPVHPNYLKSVKKPVYCFSLDGSFIAKYESIRDGANATKINEKALARCASGGYKTSGGFLWSKTPISPKYIKPKTRSGLIGVFPYNNKWVAIAKHNKKVVYIGRYKNKYDAANARNKYIIQNGLSLKLNHIPDGIKLSESQCRREIKYLHKKRLKWGYEFRINSKRYRKYVYNTIEDAAFAFNQVIISNGFNIPLLKVPCK